MLNSIHDRAQRNKREKRGACQHFKTQVLLITAGYTSHQRIKLHLPSEDNQSAVDGLSKQLLAKLQKDPNTLLCIFIV